MWQSRFRVIAVLSLCARTALGAAFALAGGLKLAHPEVLSAAIDAFGLVPDSLVEPMAHVLPPLEIAAGGALMLGFRWGLHVVTALLGVFVAVLAYGIQLGLDVDCGCYGPADPHGQALSSLRTSLYRDLVMLAVAAGLYAHAAFASRRS